MSRKKIYKGNGSAPFITSSGVLPNTTAPLSDIGRNIMNIDILPGLKAGDSYR